MSEENNKYMDPEESTSGKKRKRQEEVDVRSSKRAALEAAIQSIEKDFGKGSIIRYGANEEKVLVEVISTGSLSLDMALGIGGYPTGRIVEIFGPEMSGKTTLALHAIAEAHKKGEACCFVDTEHAFDPIYAASIGVKFDKELFYLAQPTTAEEAFKIIDKFASSGACSIIVLDSVAALVPKAELEGDIGDSHMGLQARLMSQALRVLTGTVSKSSAIVMFINQIRLKIGIVFGNPETTTGGNALKFYASVRLDVRKSTAIKNGDNVIGHEMDVKVIKNKLAAPFKRCRLQVIYGEGVSRVSEVLELGVEHKFINKSGSWYSIGDQKIGQGGDLAKTYLLNNPAVMHEIEEKIKRVLMKDTEEDEMDSKKRKRDEFEAESDDFE